MRQLGQMLIGLLILPAVASADTVVSGDISGSVIWTKAGSPYMVMTQIQVTSGASLEIAPGVVVKFAAGARLDAHDGASLIAIGAEGQEIVFTSAQAQPSQGDYAGLGMGGLGASIELSHCIIEFATTGISVVGPATIADSEIRLNQIGLVSIGGLGASAVSGLSIAGNEYGVWVSEFSSVAMTDCDVIGNRYGIAVENLLRCQVGLYGCNIGNNSEDGATVVDGEVQNCSIYGNGANGLVVARSCSVSQCNVFGNGGAGIAIAYSASSDVIKVDSSNLTNNATFALEVGPFSEAPTVDATGNWWGSSEQSAIAQRIYDKNDDSRLMTTVTYDPYAAAVGASDVGFGELKAMYSGH